jgi:transcription antitermination factor NusG
MLLSLLRWNMIYIKPCFEKKVLKSLAQKKIKNYYPIYEVNPQNLRTKPKPLFGPYIFVLISHEESYEIKKINGVINFVYWQDKPVIIPDEEINVIKRALLNITHIQIKSAPVQIKNHIKNFNRHFIEYQENSGSSKNRRIKILLPTLGWILMGETGNIEDVELKLSIKIIDNDRFNISV